MWLLVDPKFQEWKDGTHDTLFCVGVPGAGKTVMSAMVICDLFRIPRLRNSRVAVAFLYFRYDLREIQSPERLLGSLLRQLVSQAARVPSAIEKAYTSRLWYGLETKLDINMLKATINCFDCVYFVIDALDEGSALHTKDLISTIRSLQNLQVKLFATSRFNQRSKNNFTTVNRLKSRVQTLTLKATQKIDLPSFHAAYGIAQHCKQRSLKPSFRRLKACSYLPSFTLTR